MYQSLAGDSVVPGELLWKDTPRDRLGNFDFLMEMIDRDLNVGPDFRKNRFMAPIPVRPFGEMQQALIFLILLKQIQ